MVGNSSNENEVQQIRPREIIEADLNSLKERFSTTDEMPESQKNLLFSQIDLLEQELTPYKRQELEDILTDVLSRIDYDAIFESSRGEDPKEHFTTLITEIKFLKMFQHDLFSPREKDYEFINKRWLDVHQISRQWTEYGFLLAKPREDFKLEDDFFDPKRKELEEYLIGKLEWHDEELHDFRRLSGIYRRIYPPAPFKVFELARELRRDKIHYWSEEIDFSEIGFDKNFINAAIRYLDSLLSEQTKFGYVFPSPKEDIDKERIDLLDEDKIIGNIKFEGFSNPSEGMRSVTSVEEITNRALKSLPPDFMIKIRSISAKKIQAEDPDAIVELAGATIPVFNDDRSEMIAADVEIYRDLFLPESATEEEVLLAKVGFIDTLRHELGHSAHYVLDSDEMFDWERVMKNDPIAITWYVKLARSVDEVYGKKEDFADSFAMFLSNPILLQILSPARFDYMIRFFALRIKASQFSDFMAQMDRNVLVTLKLWSDHGYKPEDIKRIYLGQIEEERRGDEKV